MANDKKNKAADVAGETASVAAKAHEVENAGGSFTEAEEPEEWIQISSNRLMFDADLQKPVRGYLIDTIDFEGKDGQRAWKALVINLTHASVGLDRDKKEQIANPGTEMLVPVTFELEKFARAAADPHCTREVYIKPLKKISIGGGQTMWTYNVRINPEEFSRAELGPQYARVGHFLSSKGSDIGQLEQNAEAAKVNGSAALPF